MAKYDKDKEPKTPERKPGDKLPDEKKKKEDEIEDVFKHYKELNKEFVKKFGENPTEADIERICAGDSDIFKGKKYAEIREILKKGVPGKDGKMDTSLQNRELDSWMEDNVGKGEKKKDAPEEPKKPEKKEEKKDTPEDKEKEIEKKKKELNEPDKPKDDEKKPEKGEDETPPDGEEKPDEPEKEDKGKDKEKKPKEKKEKKGGFRNKTGRAIARPFKKGRKGLNWTRKFGTSLVKSTRRTARSVLTLPPYFLRDLGTKDPSKRTARKDRSAKYKKHRERMKKSK